MLDGKGICDRITDRLKMIGMEKEQFITLAGISSASMSQWRTGKCQPTTVKLKAAAEVLQVPLQWLVTGDGELEQTQRVPDDMSMAEYLDLLSNRSEVRVLLHTIRNSSKEEVEAVVKFFDAMRNNGSN